MPKTQNPKKFMRPLGKPAWLAFLASSSLLLFAVFSPAAVSAGNLSTRSFKVSTPVSNTSATWTFTFNASSGAVLKGISFQICDAATGTCNTPGSWSNSGATFGSLTYNGSSQSSWTLDNAGAGGAQFLGIKNNSASNTSANPIVVTFNTVTNPTLSNGTTYYVRINTYTGNDFSTLKDGPSVVAQSVTSTISVTASVDETLSFCVYTGANCAGGGSTVALGTLSTSSCKTGTSKMDAATNGTGGYSITYSGDTLKSGSDSITAMGSSATTATTGTSQFGINLKANVGTCTVGSNVSGTGSGAPTTQYNTADSYAFDTASVTTPVSIASAAAASNSNTFTASYIANIAGATPAGSYSTTITYVCTATF